MTLRHFLRMSRWARHPPGGRRLAMMFAIVALCLGLAGAEWLGLLPEGLGLPTGRLMPKAHPVP